MTQTDIDEHLLTTRYSLPELQKENVSIAVQFARLPIQQAGTHVNTKAGRTN